MCQAEKKFPVKAAYIKSLAKMKDRISCEENARKSRKVFHVFYERGILFEHYLLILWYELHVLTATHK